MPATRRACSELNPACLPLGAPAVNCIPACLPLGVPAMNNIRAASRKIIQINLLARVLDYAGHIVLGQFLAALQAFKFH